MDEASTACGIERLARRHHAEVYAYAFRLCGRTAEAEDLTQQTFLSAVRHASQLREPAAARAWLFAILRRAYQNSLRDRRRELVIDDFDWGSLEDHSDTDHADFDWELLQNAIDELPIEYKLVVLMFYFEERSYREIATEMGLPLGTVMSRLSRAKAHLRRRLATALASVDSPRMNHETNSPRA